MPLLGYDIFFILLALKDIKKAIKLKKTNKGLKSHLKARKPKFKNLIILGEESKNELKISQIVGKRSSLKKSKQSQLQYDKEYDLMHLDLDCTWNRCLFPKRSTKVY